MSCSIVSVASHSTTELSLTCATVLDTEIQRIKDLCNLLATNRRRNILPMEMEGWRLEAHCLYLLAQVFGILMQHTLAWLSWGVSGLGREEQHRCLAHSHAHPLTVPALCTHHPHAQIVSIPRPSMWDQPICLHYILGRNDCIHIDVNNAHKMVLFVEENIILTTLTMWHEKLRMQLLHLLDRHWSILI